MYSGFVGYLTTPERSERETVEEQTKGDNWNSIGTKVILNAAASLTAVLSCSGLCRHPLLGYLEVLMGIVSWLRFSYFFTMP